MNHTPTPWTHAADRNYECRHLIRLDPDEPGTAEEIGQIVNPANAAFIVESVNSYAAMLAALREVRLHLADYSRRTMYGTECDDDVKLAQNVIREALTNAEKDIEMLKGEES